MRKRINGRGSVQYDRLLEDPESGEETMRKNMKTFSPTPGWGISTWCQNNRWHYLVIGPYLERRRGGFHTEIEARNRAIESIPQE